MSDSLLDEVVGMACSCVWCGTAALTASPALCVKVLLCYKMNNLAPALVCSTIEATDKLQTASVLTLWIVCVKLSTTGDDICGCWNKIWLEEAQGHCLHPLTIKLSLTDSLSLTLTHSFSHSSLSLSIYLSLALLLSLCVLMFIFNMYYLTIILFAHVFLVGLLSLAQQPVQPGPTVDSSLSQVSHFTFTLLLCIVTASLCMSWSDGLI